MNRLSEKQKRELNVALAKKGLNKGELSRLVGFSHIHIRQVLTGARTPSVELARALAKELGIAWTKYWPDAEPTRERKKR